MVTFASKFRVFIAPRNDRLVFLDRDLRACYTVYCDLYNLRVRDQQRGAIWYSHQHPGDDGRGPDPADNVVMGHTVRGNLGSGTNRITMDGADRHRLLAATTPVEFARLLGRVVGYNDVYEVDGSEVLADPSVRRLLLTSMRVYCRGYAQDHSMDPARPNRDTRINGYTYGRLIRATRARFASLAEQVRLAINGTGDDGELFEALASVAGMHGEWMAKRVIDVINEKTSLTLVYADCGHIEYEDESHEVGGRRGPHGRRRVCAVCFEGDYVPAAEDGNYYHRDDLYYWDSDDEYHFSEEDSDSDDEDSDDDDSDDDAERRLDYSVDVMRFLTVDPSFQSSSTGDFHMGVELETIIRDYGPWSTNARVRATREELGRDYLVGKYDGSLGGEGIEWVTRPTSLATHLAKFGSWKHTRKGLSAWDPGSCGMHVHIDSRAFTRMSLGKFLQFFNRRDNADFIRGIAGRHPERDAQARDYAGYDVTPESTDQGPLATLKEKAANASRYRMVNTTNLDRGEMKRLGLGNYSDRLDRSANTIEVRVFRASMKRDRLLSQLEFTHALVVFCRTASYRDLTGSAFITWLAKYGGQYRNLCKWFGVTVVKPDGRKEAPVISEPADESSGVPDRVGVPELLGAELMASLGEGQTAVFDESASISATAFANVQAVAERVTLEDLQRAGEVLDQVQNISGPNYDPWQFLFQTPDRIVQRNSDTGEYRVRPRDPVTGRFVQFV